MVIILPAEVIVSWSVRCRWRWRRHCDICVWWNCFKKKKQFV